MLPSANETAEPPLLNTDFLWTGVEGKEGAAIAPNLPQLLLRGVAGSSNGVLLAYFPFSYIFPKATTVFNSRSWTAFRDSAKRDLS